MANEEKSVSLNQVVGCVHKYTTDYSFQEQSFLHEYSYSIVCNYVGSLSPADLRRLFIAHVNCWFVDIAIQNFVSVFAKEVTFCFMIICLQYETERNRIQHKMTWNYATILDQLIIPRVEDATFRQQWSISNWLSACWMGSNASRHAPMLHCVTWPAASLRHKQRVVKVIALTVWCNAVQLVARRTVSFRPATEFGKNNFSYRTGFYRYFELSWDYTRFRKVFLSIIL